MNCASQFQSIKNSIPSSVEIVVVSKTVSVDSVQAVIDAGATAIGENRVQEAVEKFPQLVFGQAKRHLIGHLQSNKVNHAVKTFDVIESIDSESLLLKLDTAAQKISKPIEGLIQVNTANDEDKFGMSISEFYNLTEKGVLNRCEWLSIRGIMVIAPLGLSHSELRHFFKKSREHYDWFCQKFPQADILSMGMSQDYQIAIEEGSTMVRIGSKIFK